MKKLINVCAFCLLFIFTVTNCQTDGTEQDTPTTNLKLIAPNGSVLATDFNELENLIKTSSKTTIETIEFENINYYESDHYTIAVIDYLQDGKFISLLKTISLNSNYIILEDKHSIQFVKQSSNSTSRTNQSTYINYKSEGVGSAKCIGGGCCS